MHHHALLLALSLSLSLITAAPTPSDPSILLGTFTGIGLLSNISINIAWPSASSPCTSAQFISLASPIDQGLCGHEFSAGSNVNFTNVEVQGCGTGFPSLPPSIDPVIGSGAQVNLCIGLTGAAQSCPGMPGTFNALFLCGGPFIGND